MATIESNLMNSSSKVPAAIAMRQNSGIGYPNTPPFDPHGNFPEYGFSKYVSDEANPVYELVRLTLADMGLDGTAFGTSEWSPFRSFITPGQTVVLKPNLVLDVPNQDAVTTHGSFIRPVIDYAWKALGGEGRILVCDAPQADADFDTVVKRNGLRATIEILQQRGVNVSLEDIRALRVQIKNGVWIDEQDVPERRVESVIVNLGSLSAFSEIESQTYRFHGGGYGRHETFAHHQAGRHEYCVSRRILSADTVILLPKLKTHRKAGLTCCLKNLVGINVDKNFLPHFTVGAANRGGDEFPAVPAWRVPAVAGMRVMHDFLLGRNWRKTGRTVAGVLSAYSNLTGPKAGDSCGKADSGVATSVQKLVTGSPCRQGGWQGNETIWRMILDLNRLFLFANAEGRVCSTMQRNVFYLVDGIVAGEGNGPMNPISAQLGLVIAGRCGAEVDLAILRMAGIKPEAIPLYREALQGHNAWLRDAAATSVLFNGAPIDAETSPRFHLHPPDGWKY